MTLFSQSRDGRDRSKDQISLVSSEYRCIAPRYDRRWGSYVHGSIEGTYRQIGGRSLDRVLDVGCGTGSLLQRISQDHQPTLLVGVDLSPEMVAIARRKLLQNALCIVGYADSLPFGDDMFDTVVSTNAFHYFPDSRLALDEIFRVLRPNGRVVITDWCDDYMVCHLSSFILRLMRRAHMRAFQMSELIDLLETTGFIGAIGFKYKVNSIWGLMTVTAEMPRTQ